MFIFSLETGLGQYKGEHKKCILIMKIFSLVNGLSNNFLKTAGMIQF